MIAVIVSTLVGALPLVALVVSMRLREARRYRQTHPAMKITRAGAAEYLRGR